MTRVELKHINKNDDEIAAKMMQKAENKQYLKELERRSRENIRRARSRQKSSEEEKTAHFSHPDRIESKKQPKDLAELLNDSGKFDRRYFTATMSPTADSAAINSQRSYQQRDD